MGMTKTSEVLVIHTSAALHCAHTVVKCLFQSVMNVLCSISSELTITMGQLNQCWACASLHSFIVSSPFTANVWL